MMMPESPRPADARRSLRPALRHVLLAVGLISLGVIAVQWVLSDPVWVHFQPTASEPAPAMAAAPAVPPPQVGDMAPDFTLVDVDGAQVRLIDWRNRMPVLIEFGSLSCPLVGQHADELDRLAHAYEGQAQFWFVYADEAHPGNGETRRTSYGTYLALPQVHSYGERCERAERMQQTLKAHRRVLVDMDGAESVAARYSIPGHGFVVVDIQGRISSYVAGTGHPNWRDTLLQQLEPELPAAAH
jgi:hypothetical protein